MEEDSEQRKWQLDTTRGLRELGRFSNLQVVLFFFFLFFFFKVKCQFLYLYLFFFGCVGSSFLCEGFL